MTLQDTLDREQRRLHALTKTGDPGTVAKVNKVIEIVADIQTHADERAEWYSSDMPDLAYEWGELANEAAYRLERIRNDEWGWC